MKVGRHYLTGVLLLLAFTSGVHARPRETELKLLEQTLARFGPATTLKRYFNCDNGIGWDLVSSGDARAVKVAFAVMPETDACYSEIMSVVLGQALSNNPRLMFRYYSNYPKTFPEWCVPGLIDPTDAEWKAAIDKAERAISSVRDASLIEAKRVCLAEVARARAMSPR